MTYGEQAHQVRRGLTWLLNQDHPPATQPETAMAYRDVILRSAAQTLDLTTTAVPGDQPRHGLADAPAVLLRSWADQHATESPDTHLLDRLGHLHRQGHLRWWQQAATASVVGQRDLASGLAQVPSAERGWAAVRDAANAIRALAVLDRLYEPVDGYAPLPNGPALGRAAEATVDVARDQPVDYTVDQSQWRPPERLHRVTGAGVAGAVQAQRNVAVDLSQLPSARNLHQLLIAQGRASVRAGVICMATGHDTTPSMAERAQTYRQLAVAAREIDGNLGAGQVAVAETARAENLLIHAERHPGRVATGDLDDLARVSQLVDRRIGAAIEKGIDTYAYLAPATAGANLAPNHHWRGETGPTWRGLGKDETLSLQTIARDHLRQTATRHSPPSASGTPSAAGRERAAMESLLADYSTRPGGPSPAR